MARRRRGTNRIGYAVQLCYLRHPGHRIPAEAKPSETKPITLEKESVPEKSKSPAPEAPIKELEFIVRHASGKQLSEEQVAEVQHYAKDLKYPRGSLVYGGNDEDDFLYCLPDSK